ncbi:YybH family protein [Pseudomonas bohemica]|uniref:YybH family protein n=1 Tax=Pseudomonas bohemica TaxID=2044872 RepID=UPI000DA6026B|nr:nuclear transport factor 2 family protein [Pseudomonas bohemica]
MTSTAHLKEHVQQAASELIAAFASNDTDAYFAAFSEDATFVFYTLPAALLSRAAYREVWAGWQADGFAVLDCQSSNVHINLQGDVAIFMHDVATRVRFGTAESQFHERETIVLRHDGSRWLACHEHLSAQPE